MRSIASPVVSQPSGQLGVQAMIQPEPNEVFWDCSVLFVQPKPSFIQWLEETPCPAVPAKRYSQIWRQTEEPGFLIPQYGLMTPEQIANLHSRLKPILLNYAFAFHQGPLPNGSPEEVFDRFFTIEIREDLIDWRNLSAVL
jgi:hypothetical protein